MMRSLHPRWVVVVRLLRAERRCLDAELATFLPEVSARIRRRVLAALVDDLR
ncbi:hypothetical protein RMN57_11185 [Kitasatospora sp. CM 4170]|uniref:MarR family transcriptional regulator n=1 Tax=Kitasatospora aburaviensis TaxID=67265 RepID=A0ABW1EQ14_9ACTN|nr:hypothetical protein [Kitasatospora sp. CM 4170]WNM45238.1 hypothetical protein RMN57_11185 [Kitasatospora sp. CM 4170]